ncbi:MAG: acyltransferase family protein [Bacteroidota bacterium]|jgi:peptidoglycan/LPS O-acetylase OafA/YrhL|nr:acyltransferase [Ignavibacteria bacterium]MCU7499765.1 acyltransferase [Ignavibacteria bacterium]MCU7519516.1 acyltransferase [Ignavibacteria bacterium]
MNSLTTQDTSFSDSKSHYQILDGLRGVAAVMVVIFHLFEAFSEGNHLKQIINHGYLAVDFFFVLSGFVIGYAYDDRWGKMTLKDFFKRRLIRLHPMIIVGMVIGAIGFYFSASPILFPQISSVPLWKLLLVMLVGFTLLPLPASMDIRGWAEMHPLNGPAWSLFFEYVANILYALFIRKFSNRVLSILVFLAACLTIHLAVTGPNGDVIGGWSLDPIQFRIGMTRLLYPFFAGLLLSRIIKPGSVKNAFLWCSLMVIAILSFPRVGGSENLWMNGLYDSLSIIFLFPIIVYMGASGEVKGKYMEKACRFLGDISYPIYIIHYPLIYIFTAWAIDNKIPMLKAWPVALLLLGSSIAIAYASFKLYDVPVRKWLTARSKAQKQCAAEMETVNK